MARQQPLRPKVAGKTSPATYRCAFCRRVHPSRYALKVHACDRPRPAAPAPEPGA